MSNLLISFSGGRTSAMMTKYLLENYKDKYNMIVVFANTGKERKETLDFVNMCDKEFGFNCVWVEADITQGQRKGTDFAERYYQETFVSKGSDKVELPKQETLYTEEQVDEAINKARMTSFVFQSNTIIQSLKQPKKD